MVLLVVDLEPVHGRSSAHARAVVHDEREDRWPATVVASAWPCQWISFPAYATIVSPVCRLVRRVLVHDGSSMPMQPFCGHERACIGPFPAIFLSSFVSTRPYLVLDLTSCCSILSTTECQATRRLTPVLCLRTSEVIASGWRHRRPPTLLVVVRNQCTTLV